MCGLYLKFYGMNNDVKFEIENNRGAPVDKMKKIMVIMCDTLIGKNESSPSSWANRGLWFSHKIKCNVMTFIV